MAGNCIVLALFLTLYLIQCTLTAPIENKYEIENSIGNEHENHNNLKSEEINFDSDKNSHSHHTRPKRRQKRLAVNACGGQLAGLVQTLTFARHRQAAMNFLKEVIVASEIDLITNSIDVNDFEEYRLHSSHYDYLKKIEETDEPKLSEWHHNMQMYTYTFTYLHEHQKRHRTKNQDITKELEELKITSEKILCEIQSIALHLEEKPTLKLITSDEKKVIETNLRTNKNHHNVDEIDLKYAKKFYSTNISGMTKSLTKCMQDCSCVKGYGKCKQMD